VWAARVLPAWLPCHATLAGSTPRESGSATRKPWEQAVPKGGISERAFLSVVTELRGQWPLRLLSVAPSKGRG